MRYKILFLVACWLVAYDADAGEMEKRRIRTGLRLFPSFLAADRDIAQKMNPKGTLLLVLVYIDGKSQAETMVRYLESVKKIRGIPIEVATATHTELNDYSDHTPAGIFLTQRITDGLDTIIRYGREHRILVFSPFKGDVERGVATGIIISDRILPYINVDALQSSRISLKAFFLKIAKPYE